MRPCSLAPMVPVTGALIEARRAGPAAIVPPMAIRWTKYGMSSRPCVERARLASMPAHGSKPTRPRFRTSLPGVRSIAGQERARLLPREVLLGPCPVPGRRADRPQPSSSRDEAALLNPRTRSPGAGTTPDLMRKINEPGRASGPSVASSTIGWRVDAPGSVRASNARVVHPDRRRRADRSFLGPVARSGRRRSAAIALTPFVKTYSDLPVSRRGARGR